MEACGCAGRAVRRRASHTLLASLIVAASLALPACSAPSGGTPAAGSAPIVLTEQEVRQAHDLHFRVWAEKSLPLLREHAAEDVVYYDVPPAIFMNRRAELETRLSGEFQGIEPTGFSARNEVVRIVGPVGIYQGEYVFTGKDTKGASIDGTGYFVEVFEKGSGGRVRLIHYLSAAKPAPPAR